MNNLSDDSVVILPSQQVKGGDYQAIKDEKGLSVKKRARNMKIGIVVITTILCSLLLASFYLFGSQEKGLRTEADLQDRLVVESWTPSSLNLIELSKVRQLIIKDSRLSFFDTTPFSSLEYLTIDQSVKLQELIVNNSLMEEFSYNSTELKSIKFINNTKLTTFSNSNLPNLTHFSVTQTNFTLFQNYNLSSLTNLQFINSRVEELPFADTDVKNLVMINCGEVAYFQGFGNYSRLQTLTLYGMKFKFTTQLAEMVYLKSMKITNCLFQQGLRVESCLSLKDLNIDSPYIQWLHLYNLPNLALQFYPKIQRVDQVTLNNTNIYEFKLQTSSLNTLGIAGGATRKFQDNIPGLKGLILKYSLISDIQFSRLKAYNLQQLYLQNCTNLKSLNNSFTYLDKIQLYVLNDIDLSLLNAPSLRQVRMAACTMKQFNTIYFRSLNHVAISFSTVNKLIIQDPVQSISIEKLQVYTQFVFNSSSLTDIDIQQVDNLVIHHQNLSSVEYFQASNSINSTNITNNIFSNKLRQLQINYNQGRVVIENNTFNFNQNGTNKTISISHNDLPNNKLKQNLTGIHNATLAGNGFENFEDFISYARQIKDFDLSKNTFKQIKNQNNTAITSLLLTQSPQLTEFSNNVYQNLKSLWFYGSSKFSTFKNNTLPKLEDLDLISCRNLSDDSILEEFHSLAKKGTHLKLLYIQQRPSPFESKVKEIFPNVTISHWHY